LSSNKLVVAPLGAEVLICKIRCQQNKFLPTDEKRPTDKDENETMKAVAAFYPWAMNFLKDGT
jgi:hypothetical protein